MTFVDAAHLNDIKENQVEFMTNIIWGFTITLKVHNSPNHLNLRHQ